MLHHISIGTADIVTAARFYDETLEVLGYTRLMSFLPKAVAYGVDKPVFWVQLPADGEASSGNGAHVAFDAPNRAAVDAFHAKALEMGGKDNGAPGPRKDYGPNYYGAFIIDPDGNRIEAVSVGGRARVKARKSSAKKSKAGAKKASGKAKSSSKRAVGNARKSAGRKAAGPRRTGRTRRR